VLSDRELHGAAGDRACDALGRGLALPRSALERLLPRRVWRLAWTLCLPEEYVALRIVEAFERTAAVFFDSTIELRGPANAWPRRETELLALAAKPPSSCIAVDLWSQPQGMVLVRQPLLIRLDFGAYESYCRSASFDRPAAPSGRPERGPEMSTAAATAATEPRRPRSMSLSNITDEPDHGPQATILHGPPGVGKTTFVADAPDVVFICSERGLKAIGSRRIPHFPYPTKLVNVFDAVDDLIHGPHAYRHFVIDSIDWVETLIQTHVCQQNHVAHMEVQDYKKLYVAAMPFVDRLLRMLDALRDRRQMHVWLVAHSVPIKMANSAGETWDKWELKLDRRVAERLREWADNVLFADFVTDVLKGGKGRRTVGKMKGRILYTVDSADHFAKNRNHLPERLPLSFKALQVAFNETRQAPAPAMRARLDALMEKLTPEDHAVVDREIAAYKLDDPRRVAMILTMAETMVASYDEEDEPALGPVELDDEPTDPGASSDAAPEPAPPTPKNDLPHEDPAWTALMRTAVKRIEDANDENEVHETIRQMKVVEFPRQHAVQVLVAAFRWRIAHAGTSDALDAVAGEVRAAKLPDHARKALAEQYAARRSALAPNDGSSAARP
jgi:hypothetical protein